MSKFKKYYDDPEYRERYLTQQREKITCVGCGAVVSKGSYVIHLKSEKHINNLRENDEDKQKIEEDRAEIERVINKKIRAIKRKKQSDEDRINRRIKELINMR
uniref:Uncharacterized protein n=1 Tax=viral metagenome TaxID=1070528 RepID=A0A6C0CAJ0_9ZZZZ